MINAAEKKVLELSNILDTEQYAKILTGIEEKEYLQVYKKLDKKYKIYGSLQLLKSLREYFNTYAMEIGAIIDDMGVMYLENVRSSYYLACLLLSYEPEQEEIEE